MENCKVCGKSFERPTKAYTKIYCSEACARAIDCIRAADYQKDKAAAWKSLTPERKLELRLKACKYFLEQDKGGAEEQALRVKMTRDFDKKGAYDKKDIKRLGELKHEKL